MIARLKRLGLLDVPNCFQLGSALEVLFDFISIKMRNRGTEMAKNDFIGLQVYKIAIRLSFF